MSGDFLGSNMSVMVAFVEGLASFFSACVIPLLPIYLGYLSGNLQKDEVVSRKRTLGFTLCFIAGIFLALILLNLSFSVISVFFQGASIWFMRIGGILIVLLGLMQLGLFKISFFERTFHFQFSAGGKRMNPFLAFVMGFTFSFSWTPCIGPALASILVMAQSSGSLLVSMGLVAVYACGFALPFLCISFGARYVTAFFQKHAYALAVITKIGALLLILMGSLMFFGKLSFLGGGTGTAGTPATGEETTEESDTISFSLEDQHGETIQLSDYEGKIVFLNFWATWCPNCENEIADIGQLYEKYKDSDDVAILSMVAPNVGKEGNASSIKDYINDNNITYPVLFDMDGAVFNTFGVRAFPTLFIINKDQTIYGYAQGALPLDAMQSVIDKALSGKPANEE